jgi:hypothetical protein
LPHVTIARQANPLFINITPRNALIKAFQAITPIGPQTERASCANPAA